MSEGSNSTIVKDLVTIVYDPFAETTWTTANISISHKHGGAKINFSITHVRSSSGDDFIAINVSTEAKNNEAQATFFDIEILADQEVIGVELQSHGTRCQLLEYTNHIEYIYTGSGSASYNLERAKKIASARNIEMRYHSEGEHSDLDDETESLIQEAFIVLYHEMVENIYPDKILVIKEKWNSKNQENEVLKMLGAIGIFIILFIFLAWAISL